MSLKSQTGEKPDNDERSLNTASAIIFAVFMLGIGLPVWWKTTEVYRATLPYSEIQELSTSVIHLSYAIEFIYPLQLKQLADELHYTLGKQLSIKKLHSQVVLRFSSTVRAWTTDENHAFESHANLADADRYLQRSINPGRSLLVYLVPLKGAASHTYFGQGRNFYYSVDPATKSSVDHFEKLKEIILDVFVGVDTLRSCATSALKVREQRSTAISSSKTTGVLLHPGFNLDFYLLVPSPKSHPVSIDFAVVKHGYLLPALNGLKSIAHFSITLQHLYEVSLPLHPTYDKENAFYFHSHDQLPHLITPVEQYVATYVSQNPVLNFLIYPPPSSKQPLYIMDTSRAKAPHNAFTVAGWGGVIVQNLENTTELPAYDVSVATLALLRELFGLQSQSHMPDVQRTTAPFAQWEVQQLEAAATLSHLLTTLTTLQSLSTLLDTITNIVINDDIASEVQKAVSAVRSALLELNNHKVPEALSYAKEAFLQSEKAFFDPSLLALLYFPEDQKYAIYVPLFVPVGVPVLLSLYGIFKRYREGKKITKPHAD